MKKLTRIEKYGTHIKMMKSRNIDAMDYECNIGGAKYRSMFWEHVANCYECMNNYQAIISHAGSYVHTDADRKKSERWAKKWNFSK